MKIGIVGLPNVGKSTMFNSITKAGAECANYPFCTIEPNVGVVAVPDERIDNLAQMYNPQKVTKAVIEYVVAHEFCHLKYKTHGKRFYEIIEKYIPNYKKYEREIQEYQY